jgi:hypothetical protein
VGESYPGLKKDKEEISVDYPSTHHSTFQTQEIDWKEANKKTNSRNRLERSKQQERQRKGRKRKKTKTKKENRETW